MLCHMCRALQDAGFTPISGQKTSVVGRSGLRWVTLPCPAGAPAAAPLKGTNDVQQGVHVNRGQFLRSKHGLQV